jgi:DNA mismatch repair ATPase MutL
MQKKIITIIIFLFIIGTTNRIYGQTEDDNSQDTEVTISDDNDDSQNSDVTSSDDDNSQDGDYSSSDDDNSQDSDYSSSDDDNSQDTETASSSDDDNSQDNVTAYTSDDDNSSQSTDSGSSSDYNDSSQNNDATSDYYDNQNNGSDNPGWTGDGQVETSVNEVDDNSQIKMLVYVIPQDQIAIRLNRDGLYTVSIFDISGTMLVNTRIHFEANTNQTVPLQEIPSEILIIKLQNNTNTIVEKIMVSSNED